MSREVQCNARYLLHLRGTTYSASFRYQLLCGSPVAAELGDPEKESGECSEFFQPALSDGRHFVKIHLHDGDDAAAASGAAAFAAAAAADAKAAATLLNLTSSSAEAMRRAARIGAKGQRFAREELTDDALDCYW